jgi:predicted permease
MRTLRRWLARLTGVFRKDRRDRDLSEELQNHLALHIEDNLRAGMTPQQARRDALMKLGGLEQTKDVIRERRGLLWLETLLQDLRFAARTLLRSPGFTLVAVLTLALAIGANTAIFSVVNAILLHPLPYPNADRLAIIWSAWGMESRGPASGPELIQLRQRSHSFEEIAGIWVTSGAITGNAEPEQVRVGRVTANFLPLLADKPQLGRLFAPGEDRSGSPPQVILTDGLWRRQFGADPAIVGRLARLNGNNFTVVGVLPLDFRLLFPDGSSVPPDVQIFVPFLDDLEHQSRDQGYIRMIGRLRRDVTPLQAQAEAESIAAQLRSEFKDFSEQGLHLTVLSLQGDDVRAVRPAILSLFAAVALVLLIACANVTNLLLSRTAARRREVALRSALGAARSRIVRQLLTESILLGCLGGLAALAIGWISLQAMLALEPAGIVRLIPVQLDASVLIFTFALSLTTAVLFGLAPALSAAREDLMEVVKEGGRSTTPRNRYFRQLLIVAEVSLGFMLLAGTGLMVRTFISLLRVDPGFRSESVLTFQLAFPGSRYQSVGSANNFLKALTAKLAALPGTQSVGGVSHLPLDEGLPNWYSYYWPEGAPADQQNTVMADHRSTLPGYFRSIGATLIAGREFTDTDDAAHLHVAIVDDALAEQTWPQQNPIGKKLSVEDSPAGVYQFIREPVVVIGVVRHLQSHSLTSKGRGQIYLPFALAPRPQISLVVRTTAPVSTFAAYVRSEVQLLDKDLPVSNLRPQQEFLDTARAQIRFVTVLMAALAIVALLLAGIGIYGVTSYSVAQRSDEFAIRMAFGACSADIRRLVLRQSVWPVILGIVIGLPLAVALTPLLAGLLYGVRPGDPLTLILISAFLAAVGVVSCYLPARRVTRSAPMVTLRHD